jgi:3-hydroxyacyl-CoA dehydrogenase
MGRGIASALLAAGCAVTLIETDAARADAAAEAVRTTLARAVKRGRLSQTEARARESRLNATTEITSLAGSSLVIEAVFESLELKRGVFRELDLAAPGATLASNTSSLDLDAIASAVSRPEDVVGMHFFSPADTMPLVEVVRGHHTSHAALDLAVGLSRAMGKTAVVARSGPGFIGNRIFDQYLRQAALLLQAGVTPARVDAVLEAWGMAMGPFKVLDLVGNDVTAAARRERGNTDPAWSVADAVVAKGWYGRKSGLGWYRYEDRVHPNDGIHELLPVSSNESVVDDAIVDRCTLAMVNEAARVIADGITEDPRDIDTVLVKGYGFPADRGGPIFFARHCGARKVIASLRRLYEATGDPFWRDHESLAGELLDRAESAS